MDRVENVPVVEDRPGESGFTEQSFAASAECRLSVAGGGSDSIINKTRKAININDSHRRSRRRPPAKRSSGKSRQWLQAVLDASPEGIMVEDNGRIVLVNRLFAQMLGYDTARELLAADLTGIVPPGTGRPSRNLGSASLHDKLRESDYTFEVRRRDGSPVELEAKASAAVIDGRRYVISTVRHFDGSRRAAQLVKESEQRLRQSQKMEAIGTLTGGVAHDFNNLLTAIIGNTQLALCKLAADDPLRHRLTEIEKATNRAAGLTRRLLAFSRRQHLERQKIDLNETVSEIMKLLQRVIGEDIEVFVKCAADPATVYADPAQIEQVIMNLCINAREAMPGGGRVIIETNNVTVDQAYLRLYPEIRVGRYVQIKVTDDGSGMDEETKSRVFDPFFTTKGLGQATGLGLSMAYGIVRQHEGSISFESELGQGTNFSIFLPVDEKRLETEREAGHLSLLGGTETILVAEDEESLRNLAKDILGRLGYTVLLAKNGEEAVEIYKANRDRVDMLLFDMVMPRMSGVEAYARIKETGSDVPLVFMTGYSADTLEKRFAQQDTALPRSAAAVIQKPYDVSGLGHKVREVLDARLKNGRMKTAAR